MQIVPPSTLSHPALGSFLHPCLSRYENKERKLFVFFPLRRLLSSLPRQTNAFQKPVHICLHYATWWLVGCEVVIFGSPHVQTLGLSKSLFFILTVFEVTCFVEKFYALDGYFDALMLSPSCHCKDGHIFWNIISPFFEVLTLIHALLRKRFHQLNQQRHWPWKLTPFAILKNYLKGDFA